MDLKKVAESLGSDWPRLAPHLDLSSTEIADLHASGDSDYKKAFTMLAVWQDKNGVQASGRLPISVGRL